jgi:hypothetical protein
MSLLHPYRFLSGLLLGRFDWLLEHLQVQIKKDNGKTVMVPAFQTLETIAGEVVLVPVVVPFPLCSRWCE